jgi:hypothetical protein
MGMRPEHDPGKPGRPATLQSGPDCAIIDGWAGTGSRSMWRHVIAAVLAVVAVVCGIAGMGMLREGGWLGLLGLIFVLGAGGLGFVILTVLSGSSNAGVASFSRWTLVGLIVLLFVAALMERFGAA